MLNPWAAFHPWEHGIFEKCTPDHPISFSSKNSKILLNLTANFRKI